MYSNETEKYKKTIESLKSQIEFKNNIEKGFNLHSALKLEEMKNKDLTLQMESLQRINKNQLKVLNDYDKDNRISEKLDILKSEIKEVKDTIKDYQEKYLKQDRFIRAVHEKILNIECKIIKMKQPAENKDKQFTFEEFKELIQNIKEYSKNLSSNRNKLSLAEKNHEEKLHNFLSQNKKIENEYKEKQKEYKALVFQRKEIKKKIKLCTLESNKYFKSPSKGIKNLESGNPSPRQQNNSNIITEGANRNANNLSTINPSSMG